VRDVIYWPELQKLDEFFKVRGGNPILFPFCGRTFDQGEIYHWRSPDGKRRPMPMHGIARQGDFKVRADPRGFSAQFMPDAEAREAYPFDYEFTVTYRFEPLALTCEFTLRNLDQQPIPWCAGHHFYFTAPWNERGKRADYAIRIPSTKTLRQDQAKGPLVPGPALQQLESLANPALIDVQHLGLKNNSVVFGPVGAPGEVAVRLGTEKIPPPDATFVTWTLDDSAPFYCVEPWMGPPNAPENKIGLQWVQPGQTQSFIVQVQVK
jgi:galactose mutarotase-like enzyme